MRILSSAALTALDSGRFVSRNGFAVTMPTETFALWDDAYPITVDGVDYEAGAGVFTLSPFPSSADLGVRSVDITVSGIDSRVAAQVVDQPYHQRPVSITRMVIATEAPTVIHAKVWFAGYLDVLEIKERPSGTSDIIAKVEDYGRELGRKNARTRSPSDQRQLAPDDAFFDPVTAAVNTEIIWGQAPQQPAEPRRSRLFGIV